MHVHGLLGLQGRRACQGPQLLPTLLDVHLCAAGGGHHQRPRRAEPSAFPVPTPPNISLDAVTFAIRRLLWRSRYLPFQAAHSPREAPDELQRRYGSFDACQAYRKGPLHPGGGRDYVADGGTSCAYCACERLVVSATISGLDDAIGNITTALKAQGMWENTVLVFSGDK